MGWINPSWEGKGFVGLCWQISGGIGDFSLVVLVGFGIGALSGDIWDPWGKGALEVGKSPWNIPRDGAGPVPPWMGIRGCWTPTLQIPNELEPDAFAPTELISGTAQIYSQSSQQHRVVFSPFQPGAKFPSALPNHPFLLFFSPHFHHFPDKLCPV